MAGIYIHIPFCKKRCIYCDFYSTTQSAMKEIYMDALGEELKIRKDYIQGEKIKTIYLGGGTPTQISFDKLNTLFKIIYSEFIVVSEAEITIEANPDDLTLEYISSLRNLPFNRISIGIQTFQERILKIERIISGITNPIVRHRLNLFYNKLKDLKTNYGEPDKVIIEFVRDLEESFSGAKKKKEFIKNQNELNIFGRKK